MFDLEQSIAEWRRQMLAAGIQTPVPLEELEIHLREDIEQQMQSGLNAQQAFETATSKIGQARALKTEFEKNDVRWKRSFVKLTGIAWGVIASLFSLWILLLLFTIHEVNWVGGCSDWLQSRCNRLKLAIWPPSSSGYPSPALEEMGLPAALPCLLWMGIRVIPSSRPWSCFQRSGYFPGAVDGFIPLGMDGDRHSWQHGARAEKNCVQTGPACCFMSNHRKSCQSTYV